MSELIHVATIASPHGLKGQFKLHCLLDSPASFTQFKTLYDAKGEPITISFVSLKSKQPIAMMPSVADRNAAEALKGIHIYAKADDFPDIDDDEYYPHQLAGLDILDIKGNKIGSVLEHHNFGAGDILEVKFNNGKTEMMPFDEHTFPEVDMAERVVTFVPPNWME